MPLQQISLTQIEGSSAEHESFKEQLSAMTVPFHQVVVVDAPTQVFTVNKNFQVGTKQLKVFINGSLQEEGQNYVELNTNTIQFSEALPAGTVVVFRIEGAGAGISMAGDHQHVWGERPSGAIDGVNTVFTLSLTPQPGSEQVFVNGVRQNRGADNDYIIEGKTITFNEAPAAGSVILVDYIV